MCIKRTDLPSINTHKHAFKYASGLGANLAGVTPEKAIKLAANDLLRCV